jgi:hypothetical protein
MPQKKLICADEEKEETTELHRESQGKEIKNFHV